MTKLVSYRGGLRALAERHRIPLAAFAYIGDDVNDLPPIALPWWRSGQRVREDKQ